MKNSHNMPVLVNRDEKKRQPKTKLLNKQTGKIKSKHTQI